MKLIIAGSRHLNPSIEDICELLDLHKLEPTEIVCGLARGVDKAGLEFAKHFNLKVAPFPAKWDEYGISAGYRRNKQMAEHADMLLIIWDGESRGSLNMKTEMEKLNKPVFSHVIPKQKL